MNGGLGDTVHQLRRILITGAVAAALLLVGAVVMLALSLLFQVSRFAPFGSLGDGAVLALAALVAVLVWVRGPAALSFRPRRRTLATDVIMAAPPPAPVRAARRTAPIEASGRLGAEAAVNRLITERRYDDALARLTEIESSDPGMTAFCAAKRQAISRRRARGR